MNSHLISLRRFFSTRKFLCDVRKATVAQVGEGEVERNGAHRHLPPLQPPLCDVIDVHEVLVQTGAHFGGAQVAGHGLGQRDAGKHRARDELAHEVLLHVVPHWRVPDVCLIVVLTVIKLYTVRSNVESLLYLKTIRYNFKTTFC